MVNNDTIKIDKHGININIDISATFEGFILYGSIFEIQDYTIIDIIDTLLKNKLSKKDRKELLLKLDYIEIDQYNEIKNDIIDQLNDIYGNFKFEYKHILDNVIGLSDLVIVFEEHLGKKDLVKEVDVKQTLASLILIQFAPNNYYKLIDDLVENKISLSQYMTKLVLYTKPFIYDYYKLLVKTMTPKDGVVNENGEFQYKMRDGQAVDVAKEIRKDSLIGAVKDESESATAQILAHKASSSAYSRDNTIMGIDVSPERSKEIKQGRVLGHVKDIMKKRKSS